MVVFCRPFFAFFAAHAPHTFRSRSPTIVSEDGSVPPTERKSRSDDLFWIRVKSVAKCATRWRRAPAFVFSVEGRPTLKGCAAVRASTSTPMSQCTADLAPEPPPTPLSGAAHPRITEGRNEKHVAARPWITHLEGRTLVEGIAEAFRHPTPVCPDPIAGLMMMQDKGWENLTLEFMCRSRDRQSKTRIAVEGLDPSTSGWPPPSGLWAQHAIHCATPLVYIILDKEKNQYYKHE